MKVLGITGGVGSGKSEVLGYLAEEYHAVICQLDEVAKLLQKNGQSCFEPIKKVFGEAVVGDDGELDRKRLAEIVFSDFEMLRKLNEIVHPEVKKWVLRDIAEKEREGVPIYVIEAALLPNAGYETICGEMWYIYTEESVRRTRLKASRGYTEEQITNMIQAQPDEQAFRRFCPVVIDNSGTFEYTKKQIGELL